MSFSVLEQFILGKRNDAGLCEDAIFINEHFAVVADGATSKTDFTLEGKTTGKLSGELICKGVAQLPRDVDMAAAVQLISGEILKFYRRFHVEKHMRENPQDRFIGSAAIFSNYRKEIWLVGDCQCLVGENHFSTEKKVDNILASARAVFLETELLKGKSIASLRQHDSGRAYILPLLETQYVFQNASQNNYAYTVFDGFPIDPASVKVVSADAAPIVLASDGYPKLFSTLAASEQYLHRIIEEDPMCFRLFKNTKGVYEGLVSFDDRSYLSLELNV